MDDCTELTGTIIGAAMEVHNYWGPGLIESIYEKSLQHELTLRNVEVRRQVKLQLKYKDLELDDDYALDLIVDGRVIVELKVVKELASYPRGATDDVYEVNRLQSWITD